MRERGLSGDDADQLISSQMSSADKRGPRPTDPNALAKWIVEQATDDGDETKDHSTDTP